LIESVVVESSTSSFVSQSFVNGDSFVRKAASRESVFSCGVLTSGQRKLKN
jgi:hypothetical protein